MVATPKYVDQQVHVGSVAHRWRNSTKPRGYASGHDGRSLLNSLPCLSPPSCLLGGTFVLFVLLLLAQITDGELFYKHSC